MKRYIAFLMILTMVIAMVSGCGEKQESMESQNTNGNVPQDSNPSENTNGNVLQDSNPSENTAEESTDATEENVTEPTVNQPISITVDTATTLGEKVPYDISGGNAYLVEVASCGPVRKDWCVEIPVDSTFTMEQLEYMGCCDSFFNAVEEELECEKIGNVLTFYGATTGATTPETMGEKRFLVFVFSDGVQIDRYVRYWGQTEGEEEEEDLRAKKTITGNLYFSSFITKFSEGVAWCELVSRDTDQKRVGVIDSDKNVLGVLDRDDIVEYGEFENGVSLVLTEDDVYQYVDVACNVVFSTDDEKYVDYIQGAFDGGYMYMLKTEADLTSNNTYWAVMDCSERFIFDWQLYQWGEDNLFGYIGDGAFSFMPWYQNGACETVAFYSSDDSYWTVCFDVRLDSVAHQPNQSVAMSHGWIMLRNDYDFVAVNVHSGEVYTVASLWDYDVSGLYGDGVYVLVNSDGYGGVENLAYFDVSTGEVVPIHYEYTELIYKPEWVYAEELRDIYYERACWPAYNITRPVPDSVGDYITLLSTGFWKLEYSKGAMLLQLKGKDGVDYYTLIDKTGDTIVEPTPGKAIKTIGEGLFLVQRDGVNIILDETGAELDWGIDGIRDVQYVGNGIFAADCSSGQQCYNAKGERYVWKYFDFSWNASVEVSPVVVDGQATPITEGSMSWVNTLFDFEYRYDCVNVKTEDNSSESVVCAWVEGYIGDERDVVIPSEVNGMPILGISANAFEGSAIESLRFEGEIREIGAFAFANCKNLHSVELPDGYIGLRSYSFTGCDKLKELIIPEEAIFLWTNIYDEEEMIYVISDVPPVTEEDITKIVVRGE